MSSKTREFRKIYSPYDVTECNEQYNKFEFNNYISNEEATTGYGVMGCGARLMLGNEQSVIVRKFTGMRDWMRFANIGQIKGLIDSMDTDIYRTNADYGYIEAFPYRHNMVFDLDCDVKLEELGLSENVNDSNYFAKHDLNGLYCDLSMKLNNEIVKYFSGTPKLAIYVAPRITRRKHGELTKYKYSMHVICYNCQLTHWENVAIAALIKETIPSVDTALYTKTSSLRIQYSVKDDTKSKKIPAEDRPYTALVAFANSPKYKTVTPQKDDINELKIREEHKEELKNIADSLETIAYTDKSEFEPIECTKNIKQYISDLIDIIDNEYATDKDSNKHWRCVSKVCKRYDQYDLFVKWSEKDPNYAKSNYAKENKEKWDNGLNPGNTTLRTLSYYARLSCVGNPDKIIAFNKALNKYRELSPGNFGKYKNIGLNQVYSFEDVKQEIMSYADTDYNEDVVNKMLNKLSYVCAVDISSNEIYVCRYKIIDNASKIIGLQNYEITLLDKVNADCLVIKMKNGVKPDGRNTKNIEKAKMKQQYKEVDFVKLMRDSTGFKYFKTSENFKNSISYLKKDEEGNEQWSFTTSLLNKQFPFTNPNMEYVEKCRLFVANLIFSATPQKINEKVDITNSFSLFEDFMKATASGTKVNYYPYLHSPIGGVGKSLIIYIFAMTIGALRCFVSSSSNEVLDHFNDYLDSASLICLDDVPHAKPEELNKYFANLNSMVTNQMYVSEKKTKDKQIKTNNKNFLLNGNDDIVGLLAGVIRRMLKIHILLKKRWEWYRQSKLYTEDKELSKEFEEIMKKTQECPSLLNKTIDKIIRAYVDNELLPIFGHYYLWLSRQQCEFTENPCPSDTETIEAEFCNWLISLKLNRLKDSIITPLYKIFYEDRRGTKLKDYGNYSDDARKAVIESFLRDKGIKFTCERVKQDAYSTKAIKKHIKFIMKKNSIEFVSSDAKEELEDDIDDKKEEDIPDSKAILTMKKTIIKYLHEKFDDNESVKNDDENRFITEMLENINKQHLKRIIDVAKSDVLITHDSVSFDTVNDSLDSKGQCLCYVFEQKNE